MGTAKTSQEISFVPTSPSVPALLGMFVTNFLEEKVRNIRIDILYFGSVRIQWSMLWLSTFKEPRLIGGIGAKTAQNIHWKSTKDAQQDPNMTFVTSVKQRKTKKNAECRGLTG
jgi:hypothetical protein